MSGALPALIAAIRRLLHSMSLSAGTSGGNKGFVSGSFGSVDDATYNDATGAGRTIVECYWVDASDALIFALSGNSIPNKGVTFATLTIGSTVFHRHLASYNATSGANSAWTFSGVSADPFASSPVTVTLYGG
jgi:hypothetical protein